MSPSPSISDEIWGDTNNAQILKRKKNKKQATDKKEINKEGGARGVQYE